MKNIIDEILEVPEEKEVEKFKASRGFHHKKKLLEALGDGRD